MSDMVVIEAMVDQGVGAKGSESRRAPATTPKAPGAPTDAVLSFGQTLAQLATQVESGQPDPGVLVAFVLGWQMGEVYRPEPRQGYLSRGEDDLPGLASLGGDALEQVGLDQIQAGITKLKAAIVSVGLELPNAQQFGHHLDQIDDPGGRQRAIIRFHVDLLATLTAADYRLGKAYGLGSALLHTSRGAVDYRAELAPYRVATVTSWIRELATAFPAHAARSVADSLQAWSRSVDGVDGDDEFAARQLAAQGRLWRSLLSGEKQAIDMLETSDYLRAAERTLARSAALALRFLRHYWWLVGIAVALFVAGVVVIATASGAAAIVAGTGPILVSLGLSWKAIGASLASATSRLEQPVWQAELDTAIYERITPQRILDAEGPVAQGPDEPSLAVPDDQQHQDPLPAAQLSHEPDEASAARSTVNLDSFPERRR